MSSTRHIDVRHADVFELDTHKIVYHYEHSTKEVIRDDFPPEVVSHEVPEPLYPSSFWVDDNLTSTPEPENYKRQGFQFWSNWSTRRRWWVVGLGAALILLIVGLVVGLLFGIKNNKNIPDTKSNSSPGAGPDASNESEPRPSGGSNSPSNSNSSTTTTTTGLASICNGDPRNQIRRGVLTAEYIDSNLLIFARHKSNKGIYYLPLPSSSFSSSSSSSSSANTPSWTHLLPSEEPFLTPPTSTTWLYKGTIRLSIFAVSSGGSNVLSASYMPSQGGWDSEWTNLGGTALSSAVSLCKFPAGFPELYLPDDQERVDQWTIEPFSATSGQTRVISHTWYDTPKNVFYSPWDRISTTAGTGTGISSSSSSTPETRSFTPISGPAVVCGRQNPLSSILVYSNETSTLKLRHRTMTISPAGQHDWRWTDWVDLGGPPPLTTTTTSTNGGAGGRVGFVGDPIMQLYNPEAEQDREWHFFGTAADGRIYTLKWNNGSQSSSSLSPTYRPEMVDLGAGNGDDGQGFGSVPGVVVIVPPNRKRQMHIVAARKADGGLMHKYYQDGKWEDDWEDLGVKANSAPFVFGWINERGQTFNGVAFVDEEDGLVFASWETVDDLKWKRLAVWKKFGGELSVEGICL